MRPSGWLKVVALAIPAVVLLGFAVLFAVGSFLQSRADVSGGPLRPAMAAYDVRQVALDVAVDPAERSLRGVARTTVAVLDDLDRFEIHLDDRLEVASVSVDGRPAGFAHAGGLVTADLPEPWRAGERRRVDVAYSGHPKTALRAPWLDGFVWAEAADGSPWVGVACEGDGGDLWWPCKDHPSDEPDEGMELAVTAPAGLVALANGRLLGEAVNPDGTVTTRWRVHGPINSYGVSLNLGPYRPLETTYRGIDGGLEETLVLWVLPEAVDEGRRLVGKLPELLTVLGRRFGEYPFFADKLWVAHAPYLGMEHQTLIAYGGDFFPGELGFDEVLLHELAHEWWGNKVTAADWADVWLHEGFATYAEVLYVHDTLGEARALDYLHRLGRRITNQRPLIQGRDLTTAEAFTPDVYAKGAWVLHTLRLLVGDDAFFEILWRFADGDRPSACRLVTTADFTALAEEVAGADLDWFWQRYLFTASLPRWRMTRSSSAAGDRVELAWDDPGFAMPLPVAVDGTRRWLAMPGGRATLEVPPGTEIEVDPRRELLADTR